MDKLRLILSTLVLACAGFSQPAGNLNFEVASVKKAAPLPQFGGPVVFGRRGGPGTSDPGQITWSGATLKNLLATAYDVRPWQVSGPAWLDTERYDIIAKVPPGTTKDQVNVMWQNLLADRFGVALHRVSKVFPGDAMIPAKGGIKLKETTLDPKAPLDASQDSAAFAPPPPLKFPGAVTSGGPGPGAEKLMIADGPGGFPGGAPRGIPRLDKNGVPQLTAPGLLTMMTVSANGPVARMVGKAQTMAQLAAALGNQLNHPVVDKTSLTAKYDFILEYVPEFNGRMLPAGATGFGTGPGPVSGAESAQAPNGASEPGGEILAQALQKQLGLKLVATRAPLEVLVIDKANKEPTAN